MSRKNSILGLFEPEKKLNIDVLIFLYLWAFKISCSADLSMNKILYPRGQKYIVTNADMIV